MFNLRIYDVSAFVYMGTTSSNYGDRSFYGYPVGGIHYLMRHVSTALVMQDAVALMFDGRNNFRKGLSTDYKSNRIPNPSVLSQIDSLWDGLSSCGVPCYREDGYEADDLINWCSTANKKDYNEVFIYGNDKDLIHNVQAKVSFNSIAMNINNISVANFPYSIYPGENIPFNFMSVFKVFNGCKSDCVKPFVGENGIKGRELFDAYVSLFEKENVPFLYENTTNRRFLEAFIGRLHVLTSKDKEELLRRVEIIFPAINPGITFTPKYLNGIDEAALRRFLIQYNDVDTLKCFEYPKTQLSEQEKEYIKKKAYSLETGEYAVDRNLKVNNDLESELLFLKEF